MKYLLTMGALLAATSAAAQTTPPAPMPATPPVAPMPASAAPQMVVIPAPDYNTDAGWLCRPGRQDACKVDQTVTVIPASRAHKQA